MAAWSCMRLRAAQPLLWQPGSRGFCRADGCPLCSVPLGCCSHSRPPRCRWGGTRAIGTAHGVAVPVTSSWTLMFLLDFPTRVQGSGLGPRTGRPGSSGQGGLCGCSVGRASAQEGTRALWGHVEAQLGCAWWVARPRRQ